MPLTDKQLESIPYKVGDIVDYHDHTNNRISKGCDVTFISREYIVICIHRELKTPEEAEHAVSKWREVKILVYQQHWHTIIPRNSHVDLKESPISNPQARRHD